MSIKTLSLRASALALATIAFAATEPALAAPKAKAVSSSHSDHGQAQRHHHAQRSAVRNAYGAYVGGPSAPEQTWSNYGYGSGDNARNQTW